MKLPQAEYATIVDAAAEEIAAVAADALSSAGVDGPDLSAVVLLGGGAKSPTVRDAIESKLGVPVFVPERPDEVCAVGTAAATQYGWGSSR